MERSNDVPPEGERLDNQIGDEIEAENDPGIESDEDIDGEIDAQGGSALKRRSS